MERWDDALISGAYSSQPCFAERLVGPNEAESLSLARPRHKHQPLRSPTRVYSGHQKLMPLSN